MSKQIEMKKYKSIQDKERACAKMAGSQFPYQEEAPLKYPKVRNEQEQKQSSGY